MRQEVLSERYEEPRPGRASKEVRRARMFALIKVVMGNRNWRNEFYLAYPKFDNKDGINLINYATRGKSSDPDLLAALEEWIPRIQAEQPEWFVKQLAIEVP
jgi:hypothetical protein